MSEPKSTTTTTTTTTTLRPTSPFTRALLAGALAGTTVDLSLYPLDTLKTRLQSPHGFYASGGFRGIYSGVGSCLSSAPSGALFFLTYESVKSYLSGRSRRDGDGEGGGSGRRVVEQMLAASAGEVVSCIIRVPTEVVKQRAQAGQYPSSVAALRGILNQRGQFGWSGVLGSRGFYRGFGITIMREVPFTVIQFPLWEGMKTWWMVGKNSHYGPEGEEDVSISAAESAVFGSISGAGAAAVTTPLDVLKTRVMLAHTRIPVGEMFMYIWRNEGPKTFLKGIGPRMNALIASRSGALDEEWKLESAFPLEEVNIDKLKSVHIQYQGLIREAKELSMEMGIDTEKAKGLTGEYLEALKGKKSEVKSGVSGGRASMPLNRTTTSQAAAQKEPESRLEDWQVQSATTAQLTSADPPLSIAKPVSSAQEEPKSRAEEWLCQLDILRSRAALQSSRCAAFYDEMERERIFRPEAVDEKLSGWISRVDEQVRERKELKLEMDAHEANYWELDGVAREKVSQAGGNLDKKRVNELKSESEVSGESSIQRTRALDVSAQSSASSPTPTINITISAKDQCISCLKECDTQFDIFRSRAVFLTSRSHTLDEEINLHRPQSRAVSQLRRWIVQMGEIIRERDVLKEEIKFHAEKVREHLMALDFQSSWRKEYEEGVSQRLDGLKGMLNIYGKGDLQRLEEEVESNIRPEEDAEFGPTSDPLNIALAEIESSITALLSIYRKAEISSLNSTLRNFHPFPIPFEVNLSERPAFHAAADGETKRALEDYLRIVKEEEELRAMRERRGMLGGTTRDCYETVLIAKENGAIVAVGDDKALPSEEENTTTITTPPAAVEILNANDHDEDARGFERSKYASATTTARERQQQQQQQQKHALLWPWIVPIVYIFLILLVRGLFSIFSFLLMTATERESKSPGPRVTPRLVNPCDIGQDSEYCSSG